MRSLRFLLLLILAFAAGFEHAAAQTPQLPGQPLGLDNAPQRDTTKRVADPKWQDETARTLFRRATELQYQVPDSSISFFHRRTPALPWQRDLGNMGTAVQELYFRPQYATVGPSLGYHVMDFYRYTPDSLRYYNTTKPYSEFRYQLGTKLEQWAQVLHTQNIRPDWNFSFQYRKITSPGYYYRQRTNHDAAGITTQYGSRDLRYRLQAAVVFNSMQQDENGGITSDTSLTASRYRDRATVPVTFGTSAFASIRRSPVMNNTRDAALVLDHGYTWGRRDTLYNADSSAYRFELTPRFRISHRLDIGSQRHDFRDLAPDSANYALFFNTRFPTGDSVYARQSWSWIDNAGALSGLFGPRGSQLRFSVGAGIRADRFRTLTQRAEDAGTGFSTYLTGSVGQEASADTKWIYAADARLFTTGTAAGSFRLAATAGRDLARFGLLEAGVTQQLGQAPYNFEIYRTDYYEQRTSFSKESQTLLFGTLRLDRLGLNMGVRAWLLGNYLYVNAAQRLDQAASPFSVSQAWGAKVFRFGRFSSAHEITLQQVSGAGPVNVPLLAGRSTLALETGLFRRSVLRIATGVELRYHTPYTADGYSPFLNRFYVQDAITISNIPEGTAYFNFRVKRFRASFSADNLQSLVVRAPVLTRPGYPVQDLMIRFGFQWALIN